MEFHRSPSCLEWYEKREGFSEPLPGPAFSIARGSLPGRSVECRKGFLVLPGLDILSFLSSAACPVSSPRP